VSDEAVSTTPDRDQLIATLQTLVASNQAQIDARDRVIAMLRAQLARLRRMTFGTSSEKLAQEIAQLELALEEYEAEAATADAQVADVVIKPERPAPPARRGYPRTDHWHLRLPVVRWRASPPRCRCRRAARCRAGQLARGA